MKKTAAVLALGAVLGTGCATQGPAYRVPVVEAGTPLSHGKVRDAAGVVSVPEARQPVAQPDPVVTVMTPPEAGLPAIAASSVPSAPIQVERFETSPPAIELPAVSPREVASIAPIAAPVQALINTAQEQRSQGNLNGAASSLERAQRIAPQEPQVLYRLAEVRLMQGDAAQAEQLAQRGLSYSSGRADLQAGLWDLIAEAREKRGDAHGAAEARQKARIFL